MRLDELRLFLTVAAAGGMSRAAAEQGLTQPAVSRAIAALERDSGARLFRRTGRGVALTPAGERFAAYAAEAVSADQRMREDLRRLGASAPRRMAIALPLRLGRLAIPLIVRRLAEAEPTWRAQVFEDSVERMAERLAANDYDVVVTYDWSLRAGAAATPLFEEDLHLVTAPAAAGGDADRAASLAEVAAMPLLLPSRTGFRRRIAEIFAAAGLTLRIARELETTDAMIAFAVDGDGATLLPYSNVYREVERGELVARPVVDPSLTRRVMLQLGRDLDAREARSARRHLTDALSAAAAAARWRPAPAAQAGA